jgi:hypothetical protein
VDLPPVPGTHRILNVHRNVPGVLKDINRIVSELNANIHSQILSTDGAGQLICKDVVAGLPSCRKYSEALTSDGQLLSCTPRNNEDSSITTALNNLEASEPLIRDYALRVPKLRNARAVYCGQTAAQPSAAFSDNGLSGLAAAASLCSKVSACGAGARMCSVYDMFYSVASGAIKQTDFFNKAWVYQASWALEFADMSLRNRDYGRGLADNCGGYTYGSGDRGWYGTAVEWGNCSSGQRALQFYTGPANIYPPGATTTVTNPGAVPGGCMNSTLGIACCK